MTIINKIRQEILVWSIIVGVFTVLTLIAVNFDHIHKSLFLNSSIPASEQSLNTNRVVVDYYQPGVSVVLAQ